MPQVVYRADIKQHRKGKDMSRTTQKEANILFDQLKSEYGYKSRKEARIALYKDIAPRFKRHGYDLSHYKDGIFTLSNYNKYGFQWFRVSAQDLDTPLTTIKTIERNRARIA